MSLTREKLMLPEIPHIEINEESVATFWFAKNTNKSLLVDAYTQLAPIIAKMKTALNYKHLQFDPMHIQYCRRGKNSAEGHTSHSMNGDHFCTKWVIRMYS
jgi:ClpP class serine protease